METSAFPRANQRRPRPATCDRQTRSRFVPAPSNSINNLHLAIANLDSQRGLCHSSISASCARFRLIVPICSTLRIPNRRLSLAPNTRRAMPPPNSPPHPGSHQPPSHHKSSSYGAPPPRPHVGPPSSFSGRELPALSSITRPAGSSAPSSMSISSMLGGPTPASREPHYSSHSAPSSASAHSYSASVPPEPRMHSASSDFPPFRRPQTPDHPRQYDPRGSAGPSPHGHYSTTPEAQRYGTPQSYHARHPSAPPDPSRESGSLSAGPTPSQHKPFSNLPRPSELGRGPPHDDGYGRRDEHQRQSNEYGVDRAAPRHYPFDNQYRMERDRPPSVGPRDREGRDRAYSGGEAARHAEFGLREPPRTQPYGRPPDVHDRRDPRDQQWGRNGNDHNYRAPIDHGRPPQDYPPTSNYIAHGSSYQSAPPERFPPTSHPGPSNAYESPERAQLDRLHPGPPAPRPRIGEEPTSGPTSGGYPYDPSRSRTEDAGTPIHQRNLLAVQEANRKGRMSPIPQAVQGAQPQQPGPTTEPGIKSEFGRMFAGIGSGVGAMGPSSPVTSAPGLYTSGAKREDGDGGEVGADGKVTKGKRRKNNDDGKGDDDNSGRLTPSGRGGKRAKGHHHHQ